MRLLIIEDDKRLSQSLEGYFKLEGFAVDCLFDGESGQRRIEMYRDEYDLVILDLNLPGIDGLEVCKNIRNKNIEVPILMLTARDEIQNKIMGLKSGADDYLTKPFSSEELLARVRALLRRPKKSLPILMRVGDLVLDISSRKVFLGKKELGLTLKEFSLLEYLMRNKNRVVSREDIFTNVWDFNSNAFSNVVDVHVNHLRSKIGGSFRENDLETIRGVGFCLKSK